MGLKILALMQKGSSHTNERTVSLSRGFSLVELLVAVSVFLVFALAITSVVMSSSRQISHALNRELAIALAEEGLEVVRNIRDGDFTNLVDGNYGIAVVDGRFSLVNTLDRTDIFDRLITISSVDSLQKRVVATVNWADQVAPESSVALSADLTDWRTSNGTLCVEQGGFLEVDVTGAVLVAADRSLSGITISSTATDCDIVITDINVSWDSSRRLREIFIDSSSVWIGNAAPGTVNDIVDFTIVPGQGGVETLYRFNNSVSGNTFAMTFTLSDGTVKTVTGITP